MIITLVSGNESVSGSGCVFGTGMESGNGNDIFESSYFYLDFYWTCVFCRNTYIIGQTEK
jgi:pyridoxine/pyridoxamine 5'-phosphate oxidase